MAGVTIRDKIPSEELLHRRGLTDVLKVISVRRLNTCGHVARKRSTEACFEGDKCAKVESV